MKRNLKIKVCGITTKEQAAELIDMGTDYVGMIYHKHSPRHVDTPFTNNECCVLVSVNQSSDALMTLAQKFKVKQLQLHGEETVEQCKHLQTEGYSIIKAFSVDDDFDFEQCTKYTNVASYFLFDTKGKSKGGNGTKFNWSKLNEYRLDKPFFLSGGIDSKDASAIQELTHPMLIGIDLNSKFEKSPGIKDIDKLKDFINNLRQ
jgi:phosphoribosylanthranilate isomerase